MAGSSGSDVNPVREVNRLHLVIDDWYGNIRPDLGPVRQSLADDFTWIGPTGVLTDRDGSLELWKSQRSEITGIDVQDIAIQRTIYGVHQVTFIKIQQTTNDKKTMTCSLWLRETERSPTGLQWLHLTETPLINSDNADS